MHIHSQRPNRYQYLSPGIDANTPVWKVTVKRVGHRGGHDPSRNLLPAIKHGHGAKCFEKLFCRPLSTFISGQSFRNYGPAVFTRGNNLDDERKKDSVDFCPLRTASTLRSILRQIFLHRRGGSATTLKAKVKWISKLWFLFFFFFFLFFVSRDNETRSEGSRAIPLTAINASGRGQKWWRGRRSGIWKVSVQP